MVQNLVYFVTIPGVLEKNIYPVVLEVELCKSQLDKLADNGWSILLYTLNRFFLPTSRNYY